MSCRTRTEDKYKYERDSIIKVEHVWHGSSDRWIYIERYNDDIIGLNFMQGFNYLQFVNDYAFVNRALSDFYYENKNSFREFEHDSEINLIDKVMWVYHDAISFYEYYS